MGLTTTIVLAGIALGCLQFAAGVMIGRHLPLRGLSSPGKIRLKGACLEEIARRLGLLVNRVADDVGQHQARIAQVNRKLSEADAADANSLAEVVLGAIAQMVESDARLQQRLAQAEEKLQRQAEQIQSQISEARTDPLTELPNRRAFRDELDRQIAQWQRKRMPFSLLMIDVDHFKALNDRYGHPAGDHALHEIGVVLKAALREMDLVARVGGEEFAAILPSTGLAEAGCAAYRVRQAVQSHALRFEQWELRTTVSLGLAVVEPRDGAVSLIRRGPVRLEARGPQLRALPRRRDVPSDRRRVQVAADHDAGAADRRKPRRPPGRRSGRARRRPRTPHRLPRPPRTPDRGHSRRKLRRGRRAGVVTPPVDRAARPDAAHPLAPAMRHP